MAEELALDQRLRDRRRVDGDERPSRRALSSWTVRATTSFPVPLSPVMIAGASLAARSSISRNWRRIGLALAHEVAQARVLVQPTLERTDRLALPKLAGRRFEEHVELE